MTDYLLACVLAIMLSYVVRDVRAYFHTYGTPLAKWRRKRQARNR